MPSLRKELQEGAAKLSAAGAAAPQLDARLLMQAVLGASAEQIVCAREKTLTASQQAQYAALIGRRVLREPVSRILGRRDFWSLALEISPAVLDPRPDSESLIEAALGLGIGRNESLRILDIGTGSGCLLLALLSEFPRARGIGMDISAGALDTARRNAARLGFDDRANFMHCDIRRADWASQADGPYDLAIANPPYIPSTELAYLMPEVANFDPHQALDGGLDGLDFYRLITSSLARLLRPSGWLVLEAGYGQAEAIQEMLCSAGLRIFPARCDLHGVARAVTGQAASAGQARRPRISQAGR